MSVVNVFEFLLNFQPQIVPRPTNGPRDGSETPQRVKSSDQRPAHSFQPSLHILVQESRNALSSDRAPNQN
jgi:hypothetical protein